MATKKHARRAALTVAAATATAVSLAYPIAAGAAPGVPVSVLADTPGTAKPVTKAPTATAVTPPSGTTAGGTTVTVTGSGFSSLDLTNPAAVKFGDLNAASFAVVSDTRLTAVTPAGTNGAVKVTVTNTVGSSSGTVSFGFRAPLGARFEAVTGAKGGTVVPVTVTGGTVGATAAAFTTEKVTAKVGDATATVAWTDEAHVKVTVPAGTKFGAMKLTLTHDGVAGTPSESTIRYAPLLSGVLPAKVSTAGGETVTITGNGFTDVASDDPASVTFGGRNATSFTVKSATQITAVVPEGANGAAPVVVKSAGGSVSGTVTYRTPLGLEVPAGAVAKASGGTVTLTVTGGTVGATPKEFGTQAISATVGTSKVVPVWVDATHVKVPMPASAAATAPVTLLHDGVPGKPVTVSYAPVVVNLSATTDTLAGGTKVTVKIAGGELGGATGFTFGGKEASCTRQGTGTFVTYLCVTPPATTAGPVWVSFTASTGTASRFTPAAVFNYIDLD
ncbi:Hepatocyte growth factor receptor [Actinoplanes sp. SE50]|uniref:IPT/TIG domain-containing protein n=1 Tax=unclassified Actinoplanes TaxID=2626549 RepID=UPI00023EC9B1|nr:MULTISPECIES: IPT/TIG domain-containing protein [unclassified Actinoplanes]AEV85395.1 Hepatocyte growth factor receptor [Actinoplanes sp. SE50/110]ATO83790.1 Hepatocyte growth factor receptor [Actinoplanes sp. SE50]SLM01198.1 Hepatocyte growth factor receptor [Actinoplanes sp. SE50/110]